MADDSPPTDPTSEDELLRASHEFLIELERLADLERRKRDLPPDAEERGRLAAEIEDVTLGLMGLGRYQTRLIEHQQHALEEPTAVRSSSAILAEWRSAEGRLRDARAALEAAVDDADRLRAEHRHSVTRR